MSTNNTIAYYTLNYKPIAFTKYDEENWLYVGTKFLRRLFAECISERGGRWDLITHSISGSLRLELAPV